MMSSLATRINTLGGSLATSAGDFDFWVRRGVAAALAVEAGVGGASEAVNRNLVTTEEFSRRALEIAQEVGVSTPTEVAEAWFAYQAALGDAITTTDQLAFAQLNVQEAIKAAIVAGEDEATVIRGTAAVLGEFGQSADQFIYALSVMNNVTQVTLAELPNVVEAFKMAGPQAARLGLEIGDVATAFSILADANIRGSQAGRLLSSGFGNLTGLTNRQQEALQRLFVTSRGLTGTWEEFLFKEGQFIGLFETINEKTGEVQQGALRAFYEATKNMAPAERERELLNIFGKDAGKVWATLIDVYSRAQKAAEDAGESAVNEFEAMAAAFKNPTSQIAAFGDQWEIVSAGIKVRMGQTLQSFEALRIRLGTIIAGQAIPLLQQVGQLVIKFLEWAEANPEVASSIIRVTIAIGGILAVVGPLLMALGFMV